MENSRQKEHMISAAIGILFLLLIIVFEAAQQYYYLTTFQLDHSGEITFAALLKGHLFRWAVWLLCSIPLVRYQMRTATNSNSLQPYDILKFFGQMIVSLSLAILIISLIELYVADMPIRSLDEYIIFYTFQKSPIFLTAYFCLFVTVHLILNTQDLDAMVTELSELRDRNRNLYEEMRARSFKDDTQIIKVKIGRKVKLLPISEITWIQSDDYCVRLHTNTDRSYPIRASMKMMEDTLKEVS